MRDSTVWAGKLEFGDTRAKTARLEEGKNEAGKGTAHKGPCAIFYAAGNNEGMIRFACEGQIQGR